MRPKVVIALLLPILLFLGMVLLFKQHAANASKPAEVAPAPTITSVAPAPALAPAPAPVVVKKTVTPEEREAAVNAEKDRLLEWERNDDPESLSKILGDLTHPEKEIRLAAIEATKQFGSKDAIPTLKELVKNTDDTEEQAALLEAADFLSLTPMSDSSVQLPRTPEQIQAEQQKIAQAEAQKQARIEARMQKRAGNQDSQSAQSAAGQNSTAGSGQ
jgi:HEAT repeat protein